MSKTDSINILLDPSGKSKLKEEKLPNIIEQFELEAVSQRTKNTNLSGTPTAGSFEVSRFMKSAVKNYKTARTAGYGDALKDKPVTVNIDTDKEIVEEVEQKDADMYGVDGLLDKRGADHTVSMVDYMDTAFFAAAATSGTQFKPSAALLTIKDQVKKAITTLQKTKNNYMDGVPKSRMILVFDPDIYEDLRDELEKVHTPNVDTAEEYYYKFRGVECVESTNLPDNVQFILYVKDYSIAQPYKVWNYDAEKIPLSNALALELYFSQGTKVVVPESVLWFDGTTTPVSAKK